MLRKDVSICCFGSEYPLYNGKSKSDTLANSEDPDEMLQIALFHQGLLCLLR